MQPDPLFEAKAKLLEAINQRDGALERCLNLHAEKMFAGRRIIELESQVAALQSEIETLKNQIPKDNPTGREES